MLSKFVELCKRKNEVYRFLKHNKGSSITKRIQLRNSDCIVVNGYISLGEGTRLLCVKEYRMEESLQTLEPKLVIGNNFRATRNLTIQCAGTVEIGNDVLCASDVFIIDYNHGMNAKTKSYLDNNLNVKNIVIEDGVWIGNNVIILPGVHIGPKTIIGAGAVVTHDLPEYSLAVGNPAKVIKKWDKEKEVWIKNENTSY